MVMNVRISKLYWFTVNTSVSSQVLDVVIQGKGGVVCIVPSTVGCVPLHVGERVVLGEVVKPGNEVTWNT